MNVSPKALEIIAFVVILGGLLLQILHLLDPSTARLLTILGFICIIQAYKQQVRQLQAENDQLRQQLEHP
jgi:hypothetical protein